MKFICLHFIVLLFFCKVSAQTKAKTFQNAVGVEFEQPTSAINVNLDHKFGIKPLGVRAFIGSNFNGYLNVINGGLGGYYLVGRKHSFEIGTDVQYLTVTERSDDQRVGAVYPDYPVKTIYGTLNVGYRATFKFGNFRLGIAPGLTKDEYLFGGYLSLGVFLF